MAVAAQVKKAKAVERPDRKMTPAQIARRNFKSTLPRPRQPESRHLSPLQVISEVIRLIDAFQIAVNTEYQRDASETVYAALAYAVPNSAKPASTLTVPTPEKIGDFCNKVVQLGETAEFLGVVFIQVDPDTNNPAYWCVSFVVSFLIGTDANARLLFAQQEELAKVRKVLQSVRQI